jgi:hypothetical protein
MISWGYEIAFLRCTTLPLNKLGINNAYPEMTISPAKDRCQENEFYPAIPNKKETLSSLSAVGHHGDKIAENGSSRLVQIDR